MNIDIDILLIAIASVTTFITYGWDKLMAIKRKRRISERTLLLMAFIGGSLGALCAIYLFRHKTRHKSFTICAPLFLILQIAAIIAIRLYDIALPKIAI